MKILAVDDEDYIRELIPLIAAKAGFPEVTTVPSGQAALDALNQGYPPFDCLLLDINMPDMDGIELCRRLRQLQDYRTVPVIMLTAMSERDCIDQAFKAGATDYATKPFDIHDLGARLQVAQQLIIARSVAEVTHAAQVPPHRAMANDHRFEVSEGRSDAVDISAVRNLVDIEALNNYLRQISRAGLASSQVIAIKIDRTKEIYDRGSAQEFSYALGEVADAVNEILRPFGCLMSFAGGGIFVAVSNSAALLLSSEIEANVQHLLDEKNSEYDDGTPMDIEVSIGSPIQPDYGDISDVPRSVSRAIARAESRSAAKGKQSPQVNIRRPKF